ncbi:unnamed protein product [Acanthoscelides obtectus]|uniref:Pyroglutamyl-peptidase 1 n=1 Tax=Acanthoscelides obtectus TaxID=200917 RepID=A0A9P0MBM4_ACAOB|nr:unnamed protein product [Acanthoscelides obtectus]CAK1665533.1 Pyroglutamyl-peptidase 1 [Acanthoscelides obtectus]
MSDTILVTGFGEFGVHKRNASWEAVKLLPDSIDGISIVKKEIPVVYNVVDSVVPALWKELKPLLVIHVGVSSYASKLTIEKCAYRTGYVKCDAQGNTHCSGQSKCSNEDCIYTAIDTEAICEHLNNTGNVKFCTSCNAGRYLCEYIYYMSLSIDKRKCLFVHVPPINEPYSTEEMAKALEDLIKCCVKCQYQELENVCSTL